MSRPCNAKNIKNDPDYTCFKPSWTPREKIDRVEISIEEFEALRLWIYDWLSNLEWAINMETSASTFNRLIKSAEFKIMDALINWKWIRIYKKDWTFNCK